MERTREYSWSDPAVMAELGRERSGLDLFNGLLAGELPPPPIASTLGFELVEVEPGKVVFELTTEEFLYNPIGSVHGGVLATLLDSACGCAVHTLLPAGTGYTSLDLNLRFLRPVTTATGPVRATGSVLAKGRRRRSGWPRRWRCAGKRLAHATSTCLILTG
jgi:uncharacterized protein (TIGR00369 family)